MLITPEADKEASWRTEEQPSSSSASRRVSQSRLHNFSFSSWGNQRLLRCVKLDGGSGGEISGSTPEELRATRKMASTSSSPEKSPDESSPADAVARPWNLRTRRSACYTPQEIGRKRNPPSPPHPPPLQLERNCPPKSVRSKSEGVEKRERPKFSVSLSYDEIEEDYLKMKGSKAPRRPKKRAKIVQRQLDSLFPGLWLSEITADSYKIED